MRAREDLTIRTRRDLDALNPYARGRDRPRVGRIRLEPLSVPGAEREGIENRLNSLYFACGCGEAMAAGVFGALAVLGWVTLRPGGWGSVGWSDAGVFAGMFFLLAGLGKAVGRLRARARLSQVAAELRTLLPEDGGTREMERTRCAVR